MGELSLRRFGAKGKLYRTSDFTITDNRYLQLPAGKTVDDFTIISLAALGVNSSGYPLKIENNKLYGKTYYGIGWYYLFTYSATDTYLDLQSAYQNLDIIGIIL